MVDRLLLLMGEKFFLVILMNLLLVSGTLICSTTTLNLITGRS